MTPRLGHMRAEARQPTLNPLSINFLEGLCNLGLSNPPTAWSPGVAKWAQDTKISKIGSPK